MKTWVTKDKTDWPRGEWDDEPDKAHWIDDKTGLDCLIVRGPQGALCGYVGIPKNNKHFDKNYGGIDVDVHGGLTFSDKCHETEDETTGVCHSKECSANDTVWWLGFDCAHLGDMSPAYERPYDYGSTYRDFNYVKREVSHLANQLN